MSSPQVCGDCLQKFSHLVLTACYLQKRNGSKYSPETSEQMCCLSRCVISGARYIGVTCGGLRVESLIWCMVHRRSGCTAQDQILRGGQDFAIAAFFKSAETGFS